MNAPTPCPHAWPGGLKYGILTECVKTGRHWKHQNAEGDMQWRDGAPLTTGELLTLSNLRFIRDQNHERGIK